MNPLIGNQFEFDLNTRNVITRRLSDQLEASGWGQTVIDNEQCPALSPSGQLWVELVCDQAQETSPTLTGLAIGHVIIPLERKETPQSPQGILSLHFRKQKVYSKRISVKLKDLPERKPFIVPPEEYIE